MCTVQVLLYADVMRHTADPFSQVRPDSALPRSVCRRLFQEDPPAAATAKDYLKRFEAEIVQENSDRWNFDFRSEKPLPGRYQWVRLDAGRLPPVDSVVGEVPPAETPTTPIPASSKSGKRPASTQSKITDFLHQRKRHRTFAAPDSRSPKRRRMDSSN